MEDKNKTNVNNYDVDFINLVRKKVKIKKVNITNKGRIIPTIHLEDDDID